ncbi:MULTISPECIES: DUF6026 family protein [unclassified Pseudomonas]|uniref:DUF6026 family protein n=1 Tax=unclassified Pseudomonas TaxID=196821 RepID=UPI000BA3FD0B|nr:MULTISPECIES: DUF6026 family protein [unclassified Pseudomonas]
MGSVINALPPQTLYVTVRRDELRQLKAEREQMRNEIAHLQQRLQALTGNQPCPPAAVRALD